MAAALAKQSCEKQSEIQQASILGSLNSADYCREVGRYNYIHAEQEELIHIDKGRELSAEVRVAAIEAGYTGDGPPLRTRIRFVGCIPLPTLESRITRNH